MGNAESSSTRDYRTYNVPIKLPMPEPGELDDRFLKVLKSMNLPPDKITVLKNYDNEKKWELICDQEKVLAKNPPHVYIEALKSYLDPSLNKKRFRKRIENSTKTLKELEISLRTNQIEWVWEFLNDENRGLDVLVEYLAFAQCAMVYGDLPAGLHLSRTATFPSNGRKATSTGDISTMGFSSSPSLNRSTSKSTIKRTTLVNRRTLKNSRTIAERDDVHVCITCLRAIMNYKHGFELVMAHPNCINEIALTLNNKSLRTKSLVLELLAAVCLVRGGHEIILQAFDNFKIVCTEPRRFTKLMQYFKLETENIEFMVSCMQFINIIVHSVEDLNYRVHLQHEFTLLGLDEYIERMKDTESESLQRQLQAYMDNMFNVRSLLQESELKITALERVELLEDQLLNLNEKFQEQEYENMTKIVELEKQLSESNKAVQSMKAAVEMQGNGVLSPPGGNLPKLPPIKGLLPGKPPEDDEIAGGLKIKTKDPLAGRDTTTTSSIGAPPPPPPPMATGLPPPPPPPGMGGIPPPPPPMGGPGIPNLPGIGGLNALPTGLKIKQAHQTKYRLPVLNWKTIKPEQVAGTVFNELDDESVLNEIDMNAFEEMFKTRAQDSEADKLRMQKIAEAQQKRGTSLIENNRARNIAITLRKIGLTTDQICRSVYSYDLEALPLEYVEMLPRFIPNEMELRAFKQYEKDGHPFDKLASEDKFMWLFGRVERLQQRLNIMIFLGNFNDNILTLTPQLASVIAASMSIKSSLKLKKVFEIILAFGNYMNSGKRGAVYGFKLQSLDALLDTKSTDKKQSLLHYIVSVIEAYYPDVKDFHQEIRYIDKASKVSLDNIMADVRIIKNGLDLTQREYDTHEHIVLKTFLDQGKEKVEKLVQDATTAQEAYKEVIEYFGETPRAMPPETFFPMVQRFIKSYCKAQDDLDSWRKQDKKRKAANNANKPKSKKQQGEGRKQQQEQMRTEEERMINELRTRNKKKERRAIESKDGAIEDNIQYIKSEPYRGADTHQRSFRKKHRPAKAKVSTML